MISGIIILLCISLLATADGNADRKKNQQPLISGQPQSGKYDTIDFELQYQYSYQAEAGVASEMVLTASLRRKRKLDSVDIWIDFLDENGKRLGRSNIFGSGAGRGVANRSFEVKIKVPPGSSQFEFISMSREKRDMF